MREQFLAILDHSLLEVRSIVLDERDDRLSTNGFVARSQRARRFPGNRITQLEHESREWLRSDRVHREIFPAPQFHHPKTDDCQNVANQMRHLRGTDCRGIQGRFEKIADWFYFGRSRAGVGLLDRGES